MKGILIILCLVALSGFAQNLVPNQGFEEFANCPRDMNHKLPAGHTIVNSWYTPNRGTPDYYNACSESMFSRPGDNWVGSAEAIEGKGFVGLLVEDEVREYVQCKLKEPLKAGMHYHISFKANRTSRTNYATDAIGVTLTRDSLITNTYSNLYANPYFYMKDVVDEPIEDGWFTYEGYFVADGGEEYLTIGNTLTGNHAIKISSSNKHDHCYYYIDDVVLEEDQDISLAIDAENKRFFGGNQQNMVFNGSFEFVDHCRAAQTPWFTASGTRISNGWAVLGNGPADVLHQCNLVDLYKNDSRYKRAHAYSGYSMAGLISYLEPNDSLPEDYCEYIVGTLKKPLEEGESYYVSSMIKASEFSRYLTENIGMKFYEEVPKKRDFHKIDAYSDVQFTPNDEIEASDDWVKIEGEYKAKGGEKYIVMGLYGPANPKKYESFQAGAFTIKERDEKLIDPYAYYFIDNVSVSKNKEDTKSVFQDKEQFNLTVLLDISGSMGESNKALDALNILEELMTFLRPKDRISLICFNNKVKTVYEDLSCKDFVATEDKQSRLHPKGKSDIEAGFGTATQSAVDLKLAKGNNVLLVLTDGKFKKSTIDKDLTTLSKEGIKVEFILMDPDNVDLDAIKSISNQSLNIHSSSPSESLEKLIEIFSHID